MKEIVFSAPYKVSGPCYQSAHIHDLLPVFKSAMA